MSVDLSGLPRQVTVAVGSRTEIVLPSYAGSGNYWSARCVDGRDVAYLSVELGEVAATGATSGGGFMEPPPLTLTPETAVVQGLAPGEAAWQLVLGRPFSSTETATHELRIVVD